MNKLLLFTALLIGSHFYGVSQKSSELVKITEMKEDPQNLSILNLELPIWHIFGSMFNLSLYDLKSSFSYAGKGSVNAGITYNWQILDRLLPETYERSEHVNNAMVMSRYETEAAQSFESWGSFFFKKELNPTKVTINVKRTSNVQYYTLVDAHEEKKIGIRLGYKQGFNWYNMNNMNLLLAKEQNTSSVQTVDMNSMSTMHNYKMIKAGLTISKAVNVKVTLDKYGKRRSNMVSVNNFSLIYAVQNDFEDVYVGIPNTNNNTIEYQPYLLSDENKKLPIGFEFTHKEYSKSWLSYEYGIGYYPGLLKRINIAAHFGVSVSIDFLKNNNKL